MSNSTAVPTGCFKCGRPGHWSRDCPSTSSHSEIGVNNRNHISEGYSSKRYSTNDGVPSNSEKTSMEKPKKVPRTRPKLTPELLLSDDGIGYILRHFPRSFKFHGRGHEVMDLGNLINLYSEWHSRLLPYHPFDKFVHKVEQVGTTKRVKMCIGELRDRVANGEDPLNLHENGSCLDDPCPDNPTSTGNGNVDTDGWNRVQREEGSSAVAEDDMLQEMFSSAIQDERTEHDGGNTIVGNGQKSGEMELRKEGCLITEEQKLRVEANRLKAMERAAARLHSASST